MLGIIFLTIFTVLFAILWGISLPLQGYLYSTPATRLWLRALGVAAVIATILTAWASIYKADPGRIDVLHRYTSEVTVASYNEVISIRKVPNQNKELPPEKFYKRAGASRRYDEFLSTVSNRPWSRASADWIVVAILVQEPNKSEPTRFNTVLVNNTFPSPDETRFVEANGSRFMTSNNMGTIMRKRFGGFLFNAMLNLLLAAVIAALFWVGLRYSLGHAISFALIIWAVVIFVVMPTLFGIVAPTAT